MGFSGTDTWEQKGEYLDKGKKNPHNGGVFQMGTLRYASGYFGELQTLLVVLGSSKYMWGEMKLSKKSSDITEG
ncbi:hypothetical protein ACI3LZ_000026 [Candidozyma auris]|uniref:Uncharacterized protein n=1 Tax=Candidozyma auris TaxID=498019 RepID=A0A0L0NWF3_CANAR|nr:hypothetical protein QG37_04383 [[Candida] auris]